MTFTSKKVVSASKGKMRLLGDLTMHGVTREVTLSVVGPSAPVKDAKGIEHTGASATATVNRKDFGVTYNKTLDNGGLALGEEVPITIEVELLSDNKG